MATTIAITGKGGTGKTVLAALIIKHLKERVAGPILALDADPDANLGAVLAIPVAQSIGELREDIGKQLKDMPPGLSKPEYVRAGLHQIIVETPKVDLIAMGRSEGPGCYCYINSLLRAFSEDLQECYQWVVVDNEAGLEHLSRRTSGPVDVLITVVNDEPLSIDCAERIDRLVTDLKNRPRRTGYVINEAREDRVDAVREYMAGVDMEYLGHIPFDETLKAQTYARQSVYELDGTPAVVATGRIVDQLLEAPCK